mmetsp:Transcript_8222/g.24411  ORF Transcript_8222/g.24411 Transcript_8222/m.24411 type:complete len:205 (+) Transcript_8222:1410-2024(+)
MESARGRACSPGPPLSSGFRDSGIAVCGAPLPSSSGGGDRDPEGEERGPAGGLSCCLRTVSHLILRVSSAEIRFLSSGSTRREQRDRASSEKRRLAPRPPKLKKPPITFEELLSRKSSSPLSSRPSSRPPFTLMKGCLPPNITMYMDTPQAHMSAGKAYPALFRGRWCCSGDIKAGVPHFSVRSLPFGRKTARPKSESFSLPGD